MMQVKKYKSSLLFILFFLTAGLLGNSLYAQGTQVFNDGGIELKVWLEGVWTDANCDETLDPLSGKTKYVFEDLEVRASNGTNYMYDNMPSVIDAQLLLQQYFPARMTFTVKDVKTKTLRSLWRPNNSKFRMLNPWFPFRPAHMNRHPTALNNVNAHQILVPANTSEYAPPTLGVSYDKPALGPAPVGMVGNRFQMLERTYSGNQAPDRFQWRINGMWESDADVAGKEAGFVICNGAYGLPQVAELRRIDIGDILSLDLDRILNSYEIKMSPQLFLLMTLDPGLGNDNFIEYLVRVTGCTDIFGININPNNFFGAIVNFLASDEDDDWADKTNWSDDEMFFRSTPPGKKGYFATRVVQGRRNGSGKYMILFSYEWDWTDKTNKERFPEAGAGNTFNVQAPMCNNADYVYADASVARPIGLEVYLDGMFQDNDHEGHELLEDQSFFGLFDFDLDLGFAGCSDFNISKTDPLIGGAEEIRVRGKAWSAQQGEVEPGAWNSTIGWSQGSPGWNTISPATSGALLYNKVYTTEKGMRSFDLKLEAWESDCDTPDPVLSGNCGKKCVFAFSNRCCIADNPFGGGCLIPGFETRADDALKHAGPTQYKINWRNSPPNTWNYYHAPIGGLGDPGKNYVARIKYRWTLMPPRITETISPDGFDIISCPGETHNLSVDVMGGATFYQWQYVELSDPAGPACPNIPDSDWIDIPNAHCPDYTTPGNFPTTRIYRLKIFNRAGPGSVTPAGDKFAYAYSKCIRIQKLPQMVPMYSNLGCGTSAEPILVRSGSVGAFQPVLPPDSGSLDMPGVIYEWSVFGGASVDPTTGEHVNVTFPNSAGQDVRVRMQTKFTDICGADLTQTVNCYYQTVDGGCDTLTGVIYVSYNANNSGIGTISNPYSLANAFKQVAMTPQIKHIKLLASDPGDVSTHYNIRSTGAELNRTDSAMIITDSMIVEGGYVEGTADDGSLIWIKKSDERSIINSNILERINDSIGHYIGFRAVNAKDWVIQDITLNMGNAPTRTVGTYGHGHGFSNYGILVAGCSNYTLQNIHIVGGAAGRGSVGRTPEYNNPPDPSGIDLNNPAPDGTSSGPGDPEATYGAGYWLIDPSNRLPGYGGRFGVAPSNAGGLPGDGQHGKGTAAYRTAGAGGEYNHATPGNRNGRNGANGTKHPSNAANRTLADLTAMTTYFLPTPILEGGGHIGDAGSGGGGGASGGNASANGGAGGIGGRGGLGGYSGGGAFGLWVVGNSTAGTRNNVTVDGTNLLAGARGVGGTGEAGQIGGQGYGGGYPGGNGGRGGGGPDGGDGYSLNEYIQGGSVVATINPGDPLTPVLETDYGSGCTYSVFRVENSSNANWVGVGGGIDVKDIRQDIGSQTGSTANPRNIYFTNTALKGKTLELVAGDYRNQIYVRYQRELPEIFPLPTTICHNTPIDLLSDPKSEFHTEYKWTIQAGNKDGLSTIVGLNDPAPTYTFASQDVYGVVLPNSTTENIVYQIKFEVKDACCGWSIPVYKTITVLPEIVNEVGVNGHMDKDTIYICNQGRIPNLINKVGVIQTTLPNNRYQWMVSKDGAPYDSITPGGGNTNLTAREYFGDGDNGTYRYVRLIGSGNPNIDCADTSNVITVIVTDNISNNLISPPGPTICGDISLPSVGTTVQTGGQWAVNIGYMGGNVPDGPGGDIEYRWQYGRMDIGTNEIGYFNYNVSGPTESGTTSNTQDFDPGVNGSPNVTYGQGNQVFYRGDGVPGQVFFRRIAELSLDKTNCKDTSNVVIADIPLGAKPWGNCAAGGNFTKCKNDVADATGLDPNDPDLIGKFTMLNVVGQGLCLIEAPDTVCPGRVIAVTVPHTQVGINEGTGALYAWYSVKGGPYNNSETGGRNHFCYSHSNCTNPLLNDNCTDFNGAKPPADSTVFLGTTPADTDTLGHTKGSHILASMFETTTFYVNIFDECFSDADFRSDPSGYISTNIPGRWQRKTVVVREPIYPPTDFTATPSRYCENELPDSVVLEVIGGDMFNAGQIQIFENDTTDEANIIYTSLAGQLNAERTFSVKPAPGVTTTYYARAINGECDTTDFIPVTVVVDDSLKVPSSLSGPDVACDGESITLTVGVDAGTPDLTGSAEWVLYFDDVLPARVASNQTGIFNVTAPATSGNHHYIVRAEYSDPLVSCSPTDTVMLPIEIKDDCVCDDGYVIYAPDGMTTHATIECLAPDGWTYYANFSNPDEFVFAIKKEPNAGEYPSGGPNANNSVFTAEVYITVTPNPTTEDDVFFAQNGCEANFVMPRYWNVNVTSGSIDGYVKTRFFFKPEELIATRNRAVAWKGANQGGCDPLLDGPDQVFKTTGTTSNGTSFNAGPVTPYAVPVNQGNTDIQAVTINNYKYIGHLFSNLSSVPEPAIGMINGKQYVEVAWDGFSGGGVAIRVSPDLEVLPVTLVSFTGTLVEGDVLLNWHTASELNNDHFVVERSVDATNWKAIGSVKGNGTTNEPHYYSLTDASPAPGGYYYRLKQVDYDGKYEYSRIIYIQIGGDKTSDKTFVVQPNPTDGLVTASISSDRDQQINLRILDVRGRVIGNRDVSLGKGMNQVKVDLSHYPAATYILSFTDANGQEYNAKVVKQ